MPVTCILLWATAKQTTKPLRIAEEKFIPYNKEKWLIFILNLVKQLM